MTNRTAVPPASPHAKTRREALVASALDAASRHWCIVPVHWLVDGACSCGEATCAHLARHPLTPEGIAGATKAR